MEERHSFLHRPFLITRLDAIHTSELDRRPTVKIDL